MRKISTFSAAAAFALLGTAAFAQSPAAPADEAACKKANLTWANDACFTGKSCSLKPSGTGFEAVVGGKIGCSPRGPDGKTAQASATPAAPATAPAAEKAPSTEALCVERKYAWSAGRCFTGATCNLQPSGTGFDAWSGEKRGCSAWGPAPRS